MKSALVFLRRSLNAWTQVGMEYGKFMSQIQLVIIKWGKWEDYISSSWGDMGWRWEWHTGLEAMDVFKAGVEDVDVGYIWGSGIGRVFHRYTAGTFSHNCNHTHKHLELNGYGYKPIPKHIWCHIKLHYHQYPQLYFQNTTTKVLLLGVYS